MLAPPPFAAVPPRADDGIPRTFFVYQGERPVTEATGKRSPVPTLAALHSPSPSLKLSVGFAQAALTPQRDAAEVEERRDQRQTSSSQQVRRYPRRAERSSKTFARAALVPQRDPRSRGESKGKPAALRYISSKM
ncbi:hypothetical protein NDU88_002587 [Pleurodeles waltl]|uniref:Uncharacterized protein n=1 Tax=Pleurodeles waltl TaxID=8319 RepID=A0AAV7KV63_PLEWA|nr:hypothetical protein NDU88_002587 [Pleurodeles waltl]